MEFAPIIEVVKVLEEIFNKKFLCKSKLCAITPAIY